MPRFHRADHRRWPGLVALLALGLMLLTGLPVRAQEATPVTDSGPISADITAPINYTAVRYLLPFSGDGLNPALTVESEATGTCDAASVSAAARPDAFSCLTDQSAVLDPCFQTPFSTADAPGQLACLASPFAREVVLLTVTAPLPSRETDADLYADDPATDLPWALELGNGSQCTIARGATVGFAGMRVNYFCPGGSILGAPDRTQPVWTVQYLADGALVTDQVPVRAVWP